MKILITADPELPVPPKLYGGIERIIEMLIKGLLERGHEVVLCANRESQVPCELIPWKGKKSQNRVDLFKNFYTLSQLTMRRKFDVLHSFSRLAYMTTVLPTSLPKIMSYQREPSLQQIGKAVKLAKKNSLVFTGCSNYISDQIRKVAEAYTVYNCAPFEKYSADAKAGSDAPLVFLGRIEEIKGTHTAVEVAMLSGKRLIIAGNIPPEGEVYFEEKVKPFLNDRIQYIGPVNDVQKNSILKEALAFLMPIQWNEPFGIVMAEAMACGAPVLGFPLGSVPEVVDSGITGYVCRDLDDMVAKVSISDQLDRLNIRKEAEKRFGAGKIVSDYLDLYTMMSHRDR